MCGGFWRSCFTVTGLKEKMFEDGERSRKFYCCGDSDSILTCDADSTDHLLQWLMGTGSKRCLTQCKHEDSRCLRKCLQLETVAQERKISWKFYFKRFEI